ncbi:MAG: histone-like protein [Promethearchaeota archaeon]
MEKKTKSSKPKSIIKKSKSKKTRIKKVKSNQTYISKAPVKRFMKEQGATLISDEAIELLIKQLEIQAKRTTKKALSLVKDERRKRLSADDIIWASKE